MEVFDVVASIYRVIMSWCFTRSASDPIEINKMLGLFSPSGSQLLFPHFFVKSFTFIPIVLAISLQESADVYESLY